MPSLKIRCGDEIRRIKVDDGATFADIVVALRTLLSVPDHEDIIIRYLDDEGDKITLSSDVELREALSCCKEPIQLYVTKCPRESNLTQSTLDNLDLALSHVVPPPRRSNPPNQIQIEKDRIEQEILAEEKRMQEIRAKERLEREKRRLEEEQAQMEQMRILKEKIEKEKQEEEQRQASERQRILALIEESKKRKEEERRRKEEEERRKREEEETRERENVERKRQEEFRLREEEARKRKEEELMREQERQREEQERQQREEQERKQREDEERQREEQEKIRIRIELEAAEEKKRIEEEEKKRLEEEEKKRKVEELKRKILQQQLENEKKRLEEDRAILREQKTKQALQKLEEEERLKEIEKKKEEEEAKKLEEQRRSEEIQKFAETRKSEDEKQLEQLRSQLDQNEEKLKNSTPFPVDFIDNSKLDHYRSRSGEYVQIDSSAHALKLFNVTRYQRMDTPNGKGIVIGVDRQHRYLWFQLDKDSDGLSFWDDVKNQDSMICKGIVPLDEPVTWNMIPLPKSSLELLNGIAHADEKDVVKQAIQVSLLFDN